MGKKLRQRTDAGVMAEAIEILRQFFDVTELTPVHKLRKGHVFAERDDHGRLHHYTTLTDPYPCGDLNNVHVRVQRNKAQMTWCCARDYEVETDV